MNPLRKLYKYIHDRIVQKVNKAYDIKLNEAHRAYDKVWRSGKRTKQDYPRYQAKLKRLEEERVSEIREKLSRWDN